MHLRLLFGPEEFLSSLSHLVRSVDRGGKTDALRHDLMVVGQNISHAFYLILREIVLVLHHTVF